jgi:hypothetical protein
MERAYGFVEIKALSEEQRLLEGWATRVEPDRALDVVEPKGAVFKLPLPLLMDHDAKAAVGSVIDAKVSDVGIRFKAKIAKIAEPGMMKDLCDAAWTAAREGLRRAVSIGFLPKQAVPLPTGGTRFLQWDWYELSMVSVPCAPGATIDSIKSFDRQLLSRKTCRVVRLDKPVGAPRKGISVVKLDNAPWLKRDGVPSSGDRGAVADALLKTMDEHIAEVERAKEILKHPDSGMIGAAFAATAKTTDAELAALRARLDKLENKR